MRKSKPDLLAILRTLLRHRVEFIIVGGVAAVLHGAPISTFDLDLVHRRGPDNVGRLLKALAALEARYRTPGIAARRPDRSHLSSPGHQLLMTRAGPLDLLGTIGQGLGYDELIRDAVEMRVGPGLRVHVLGLSALIRAKEELGQDKDRAVLAVLRRTLEEKNEKEQQS